MKIVLIPGKRVTRNAIGQCKVCETVFIEDVADLSPTSNGSFYEGATKCPNCGRSTGMLRMDSSDGKSLLAKVEKYKLEKKHKELERYTPSNTPPTL